MNMVFAKGSNEIIKNCLFTFYQTYWGLLKYALQDCILLQNELGFNFEINF